MSSLEQQDCQVVSHDDPWSGTPGGAWDSADGEGVTGWGTIRSTSDKDPATHDPTFAWSTEAGNLYSNEMCQKALRGEDIPPPASDGEISKLTHAVKLCILRGIRHHHGFGNELMHHAGKEYSPFRRALNARAIMSNVVPDMDVVNDPDSVPYCIWYPDVASEDTYRELATRYPQMRYQVGRACAVAGYSRLYKELNLLPDLSIAEEARDSVKSSQLGGIAIHMGVRNSEGSAEILEHILQQPVRFHVMNDYTRIVSLDNPLPARHGLNGDTAVVSTLQLKRRFLLIRQSWNRFHDDNSRLEAPMRIDDELAPCYFNITEDWNIDEYTSTGEPHCQKCGKQAERPQSQDMLELLWSPLPYDLPWGDKDLLILIAAYHGDVDRYARLRRPPQHQVSFAQLACLVRGIYHHTAFARWCSIHLADDRKTYNYISSAITARFIMSNDLSRISGDDEEDNWHLPIQIWYPTIAAPSTYRELALRKSGSKRIMGAVTRALIIANYQDIWDELVDRIEPFAELIAEAEASPHGAYFLDSLRNSCAKRMLDYESAAAEKSYPDIMPIFGAGAGIEKNLATDLKRWPGVDDVNWDTQEDLYTGAGGVDVSRVELFIAAPREDRPPEGFERIDLGHLYQERRAGGDLERAYRRRGDWGPRRGRGGLRGG